MATQVFPLPFNVPIVDPATGFPTPFFTNMIQQWLAEKAITDGQAQGAAVAGDALSSGITSAAHTILGNKEAAAGAIEELTASQVLDLIGSMRGQILFRGAGGWSALAPGTSGNFLKTNGAGADPAWAAGGGGARTLIEERVLAAATASAAFSSLGSYRDVIIVVRGRGDATATNVNLLLQLNGDTSAIYDHELLTANSSTIAGAGAVSQTEIRIGVLPGDTAPTNASGTVEATISNATGTTFNKAVVARGGMQFGSTAAGQHVHSAFGEWRSTAAVTSLLVKPSSGNFKAGTVISVYGSL